VLFLFVMTRTSYVVVPEATTTVGTKSLLHAGYESMEKKVKLSFCVVSSQGQTETTSQEIEMEEDYPIQQENPLFLQLRASLFPSNWSSTFRGRHSLFRPRRRAPVKASPLHVAMAAIMKR
jgi:hypothetical protein